MRAVEDCYRLTVCLGSPRLKAWRDTAQGGQSNFRHFVVRAVPSRLVTQLIISRPALVCTRQSWTPIGR